MEIDKLLAKLKFTKKPLAGGVADEYKLNEEWLIYRLRHSYEIYDLTKSKNTPIFKSDDIVQIFSKLKEVFKTKYRILICEEILEELENEDNINNKSDNDGKI